MQLSKMALEIKRRKAGGGQSTANQSVIMGDGDILTTVIGNGRNEIKDHLNSKLEDSNVRNYMLMIWC